MFDYYEPLRTESPDGLMTLPFVIGFKKTDDNHLILLKGFASTADFPSLKLKVATEAKTPEGYEYGIDTGAETLSKLMVYRLTPEYVLTNKEFYPFTEAQFTALLQPGNLSLYAQATVPEWYEEMYPPPPEPAEESKAPEPEWKDHWSM